LRVANSVGDLLALAPVLPRAPYAVCFKDNLRRLVDEFAAGNQSHFARLAGVSLDSIKRWLVPNSSIRLDSFLRMCCSLQLPAARLVTEHLPANDPNWEGTRHFAKQTSSCVRRPQPCHDGRAPEGSISPVRKNRRWSWQGQDRIRDAFTKAAEEIPAPSLKEVASRVGHTAAALRTHFPELSAALLARIPERRLFARECMRDRLQAALELNPPLPMKHIAQSIGKDPGYLRSLFPGLCRQITDRYFAEKRKTSAQRKLRFHAEIRTAVAELCERGINPSRKHVFAAIREPSMKSCHILDQQIAQTLCELEAVSRTPLGAQR